MDTLENIMNGILRIAFGFGVVGFIAAYIIRLENPGSSIDMPLCIQSVTFIVLGGLFGWWEFK
jgi:hypothetical protein